MLLRLAVLALVACGPPAAMSEGSTMMSEEWFLWPEGKVPHPAGHGRYEDESYFTERNIYSPFIPHWLHAIHPPKMPWSRGDLGGFFAAMLGTGRIKLTPEWMSNVTFYTGPRPVGSPLETYLYYNVTQPVLWPFIVDMDRPDRSNVSVIVVPGGGFQEVGWDEDGPPTAQWLNSLGISAFVLLYRVPWQRSADMEEACDVTEGERCFAAFWDMLRAVRMVQHQAPSLGLDPARVGCLGFSAGGRICSSPTDELARIGYPRVDAADNENGLPYFKLLVYGDEEQAGYNEPDDKKVHVHLPMTFIAHQVTDRLVPPGRIPWYTRYLYERGAPGSEVHIFVQGIHGLSTCNVRTTQWLRDEFKDYCEWLEYARVFLHNKVLRLQPPTEAHLPGSKMDLLPEIPALVVPTVVALVAPAVAGALLGAVGCFGCNGVLGVRRIKTTYTGTAI